MVDATPPNEQMNPLPVKPIIERHLQTLLLGLVVALLGWSGNTTLKLTENGARQDERITHLIALTEQLRQDIRTVDSQYITRREAEMYRSSMLNRVGEVESRLTKLEDSRD